ncbi:MAG: AI-2E family transporter [Lachnospiraceae bacterium]|nr:AI-2E family transporter [Lachnospiraceae bacterium]
MKFNWDKKYIYWGVTAFFVIVAGVLFYFLIFQMGTIVRGIGKIISVLNPLIYGGIIAYLLNPLMNTIENLIHNFCKKQKWNVSDKVRSILRLASIIISLLLAILCIYGLMAMLIPEVIASISNVVENFPRYADNLVHLLTNAFHDSEAWDQNTISLLEKYSQTAQNWLTGVFMPQINSIIGNLSSGVFDMLIFLKNILIGTLISIYILYGKENYAARAKRILYAVCGVPFGNKVIHNMRFTDEKFGSFIIGKLIDSAIIGVLCYIGTSFLKTPYSLLISVIVGVTNIIPFFGPFLGAVPSAFLILVVDPKQCLYFILFVLILQQLDGNFIGPKILGNSTGVSSFMVVVAIIIGGGFFGVFGMFVGVPVCAVIIAFCQEWMERRIQEKEIPNSLELYKDLEGIDPVTMKIIPRNQQKGGPDKLYRETNEDKQAKQERRAKRYTGKSASDHDITQAADTNKKQENDNEYK